MLSPLFVSDKSLSKIFLSAKIKFYKKCRLSLFFPNRWTVNSSWHCAIVLFTILIKIVCLTSESPINSFVTVKIFFWNRDVSTTFNLISKKTKSTLLVSKNRRKRYCHKWIVCSKIISWGIFRIFKRNTLNF